MKIIFFSDIHGNIYAFEQFLKAVEAEKADHVVFCGDIFGYYYYQNEILDVFRDRDFKVLLGNHDQYFLDIVDYKINEIELISKYGNSYFNILNKISKENLHFVKTLSPSYEINIDGLRIGIFHGTPDDPLNGRFYPDYKVSSLELYQNYDYIILGHTHHKMVRLLEDVVVLNPGSLGQPRDGKGSSYLILDTIKKTYEFRIIEYEVELLINDIKIFDPKNEKLIELVTRKR